MYSLNIRFVLFRTWQITWIALLGTMQPLYWVVLEKTQPIDYTISLNIFSVVLVC